MIGINSFYNNYFSYSNYGKIGAARTTPVQYAQSKGISDFLNTSYQNNASSALSFLPQLKESAGSFSSAVKSLTSTGSNGVFSKKAALSSNSDVLSAKLDNRLMSNGKPMEVTISQVALSQKNEGKSLSSSGKTAASGAYGFSVDIEGKSHTFSINVTDKDNAKTIQQKMADTVNAKNIGVKASVQSGDNTSSSKLVFESATTGTKDGNDKFAVKDLYAPSGSSGLVSQTGTDTITQKAQNARYSVNDGAEKTSESNDVNLGNGVTATLKKSSQDPVRITYGADKEAIKSAVNNFVESYNSLVSVAKSSSSSKLLSTLSGATGQYAKSLSNAGIEISSSGKLSVNSSKLDASIGSGLAEDVFKANTNYGLGGRLQNTANSIERNPMSFANVGSLMTTYNMFSGLNSFSSSMFSGSLFNYML